MDQKTASSATSGQYGGCGHRHWKSVLDTKKADPLLTHQSQLSRGRSSAIVSGPTPGTASCAIGQLPRSESGNPGVELLPRQNTAVFELQPYTDENFVPDWLIGWPI